ncbi:aminofutalosine synthase MqnE [bacterium]|nr:aminofutalosine synthase MqnE [bacterium]
MGLRELAQRGSRGGDPVIGLADTTRELATPRARARLYERSGLAEIAEKVRSRERLSREEGEAIFRCPDLFAVGALADEVRVRLHGDTAYYNRNMHMNPTNVCIERCLFCGFARRSDDEPGAFTLSPEAVFERVASVVARSPGLTEVHVVGGLHPKKSFDYYLDVVRAVRRAAPRAVVKAYTAEEIDHFARIASLSLEAVLVAMREAGVTAIPGGGAEIFDPVVRKKVCAEKIPAERWFEVHAEAHRLGIPSNATMLFGHVETPEHRVDHVLRVREGQDRSRGFQTFIPLPFNPKETFLRKLTNGPTGADVLRTLAVSRLLLDNVPHLKAYWVMCGLQVAQVALGFGVDDLDGTLVEEKIVHMAGAETPIGLTEEQIVRTIREAGRTPVERDSFYRELVREPREERALAGEIA